MRHHGVTCFPATVVVCLSIVCAAVGQDDIDRELERTVEAGWKNLEAHRFDDGIESFTRALELKPDSGEGAYGMACALSLKREADGALEWLRKSIQLGYDNLDHIEKDPDLEYLRKDSRYSQVIAVLRGRPRKAAEEDNNVRLMQTLDLVVMIERQVEIGGSTAKTYGAGILFGHKEDQAFVATANHVVRPGTQAHHIRVMFRSLPGQWLEAKLTPRFDVKLDLAVLSLVGLKSNGVSFCSLPLDRAATAAELKRKQAVYPVGYPDALWGMPVKPDLVSQVIADQISFQSEFIAKGHSGGALLTEQGDLAGMLRAEYPPNGVAISIEKVIKTLSNWGFPVQLRRAQAAVKTPLHMAVEQGALNEVRSLLENCADPNAPSINRWTPLHEAAKKGSAQAAELLIEAGAHPYSWTYGEEKEGKYRIIRDWSTPLHVAAEHGATEVVKILLRHGMNANVYGHYRRQERKYVNWAERYTDWADWSAKSTRTPLHVAAQKGRADASLALIDGGADVNAISSSSRGTLIYDHIRNPTPLHYAAENDSKDVARVLLMKGAKPNGVKDEDADLTPLHAAAIYGARGVAAVLIQHGAQVDAKSQFNITPLHLAARTARPDVAKILLDNGANANARGYLQRTPLHYAVEEGSVDTIRTLLSHGANPDLADERGKRPLDLAQEKNATEKIGLLLRAEARPISMHAVVQQYGMPDSPGQKKRMSADVESARLLLAAGARVDEVKDGLTPLHRGAAYGLADMVKLLIGAGSDVNAVTIREKDTPLHLAVRSGHGEVAKLLIDSGARLETRNGSKLTPLHVAAYEKQVACMKVLLDAGADVHAVASTGYSNTAGTGLLIASFQGPADGLHVLLAAGARVTDRDEEGTTPLHHSARHNDTEFVRLLLSAGASVAARDRSGDTPLHSAASMMDKEENIQLLLNAGADPAAQNQEGSTPLHLALRWQMYPPAIRLLDRGAPVQAVDSAGNTPLHILVRYARRDSGTQRMLESKEVLEALLKRHADVNARNKDGETALSIAMQGENDDLVNRLRARGGASK